MRLLDCETSLGALGASSGFPWSLFDSSWGLLEGSSELFGSSWARPRLRKPFTSQKRAFRLGRSTILETCPSKEREARAVRNHEHIRR